MDNTKTEIPEEVLYKYLEGETTPEQNREIFEYIDRSEESARRFFDLKAVWNAHNVLRGGVDKSCNSVMKRMNSRVDADRKQGASRRMRLWIPAAGIAAAVVALAVIIGIGRFRGETTMYENPSAQVMTTTLEDGSQVWLGGGSSIAFTTDRKSGGRTAELHGEAYFDVRKGAAGETFRVVTERFTVEVLGTSFNVQAYKGRDRSEIMLRHGAVRLLSPQDELLAQMEPNQVVVFDNLTGGVEVIELDVAPLIEHKYNLVAMSDATIDQILSQVETTFGVELRMENRDSLKLYNFNFLTTDSPQQVVEIIEFMTGEQVDIR